MTMFLTDHQLTEPTERPSGCGCDGDCSENCSCICHWRETWDSTDWELEVGDQAHQRDLEEA